MISYGKQSIDKQDIESVTEILKAAYLTQGPVVEEFEKKIAQYCGSKYCVVVSNGTAALDISVAALMLEKGCEGITTPNTFVATSNSMIYNDIVPVFADIDKKTYNISPESVKSKISIKTRLLIPVHFAGQPCNMPILKKITEGNNLRIIEDASHAIGSNYKDGDRVGSCKYSDMTVFSFHPVKTITTAEGGAITTNDEMLYEQLLLLRNHGITKKPELLEKNPGPWYYEMKILGRNYRMTELQAALGINQLHKLDSFKKKRREIVRRYNNAFSSISSIICPYEENFLDSCFHLYVVQINFKELNITRSEFMTKLIEEGIGTQVHYIPVNSQPYYMKNYKTTIDDTPNARDYYEATLSLPLYPDLIKKEQDLVIDKIISICRV